MTTPIHPLTDQRKRRPEDNSPLADGEYVGFELAFMDAASRVTASTFLTDAAPGSIDAAVKAAFEQAAKAQQIKPADWLAKATPRDIERIIESAAKGYVGELSAAGIASGLALDKAVEEQVQREYGAHLATYAFMGDLAPKFDRANAEFLARNRLMTDSQKDAKRSKAFATARYQDAAYEASKTGLNSWRGGPDATRHQDAVANATGLRDALRAARYTGE